MQVAHIDNRATLSPGPVKGEEPWLTRFNVISAEVGTTGDTTLAAMVAGLVLGGGLLIIASGLMAAILAMAGGFLTAMAVRTGARRQIGGQTGDGCGAAAVLAETAMLAIAAARFS